MLIRQILRKLQQIWNDLSYEQQITAVHAVGRLHYDITNMLNAQQLLPQLQQEGWMTTAAAAAAAGSSEGVSSSSSRVLFRSPRLASRVLWTFGVVGKHPGPAVLDAALQTITAAAAAVTRGQALDIQDWQQLLPLREISNALYAAAVLHELTHPAAAALVQQLAAAAAAAGNLISHPDFTQQSQQLAACLLASQISPPPRAPAAATAAAAAEEVVAAAAASAAITTSSSSSNPWSTMDTATRQRLLEGWRRRVLLRSQQPLHRQQRELVACCQDLGLRCRGNAVTDDGCVCIDVAATAHTGEVTWDKLCNTYKSQ